MQQSEQSHKNHQNEEQSNNPIVKSTKNIVRINEKKVQQSLFQSYSLYRQNLIGNTLYFRFKSCINGMCAIAMKIFSQFWNEIIPEMFRGLMEYHPNLVQEQGQQKQKKCFQQYKTKKVRFFIIAYDDQCSLDEIQDALQKASLMTVEGRAIKMQEMLRETNCSTWRITEWSRTKKYSILFFKFDIFGHLLNFGNLTKQQIDSNRNKQNYFEKFKQDLGKAYTNYQTIQRQFLGSFMEKEDRMLFE